MRMAKRAQGIEEILAQRRGTRLAQALGAEAAPGLNRRPLHGATGMRAGDIDFVFRAPVFDPCQASFGRRSGSFSSRNDAPSFSSGHPALPGPEFDHGLPMASLATKPPLRQLQQEQRGPSQEQPRDQATAQPRRSMAPVVGSAPQPAAPTHLHPQEHPPRPYRGGSAEPSVFPAGPSNAPVSTRRKASASRRSASKAHLLTPPDASVGLLITTPMSIGLQTKPAPRGSTGRNGRPVLGLEGGLEDVGKCGMERASMWSEQVENAYRLQEAGYRDLAELLQLGQPEPPTFPNGFIKKVQSKLSLGGAPSYMYFSSKRECADKDLNQVKLYYVV